MGRHRHKKVSDKDAEENITKQLVESGKKEELKMMVQRKFMALSFVRFCAPLQADYQLLFSLSSLFHKKHSVTRFTSFSIMKIYCILHLFFHLEHVRTFCRILLWKTFPHIC